MMDLLISISSLGHSRHIDDETFVKSTINKCFLKKKNLKNLKHFQITNINSLILKI